MKYICPLILFSFVFIVLSYFYPKHAFAAISSCTANVDVTSIDTYTTNSYGFNITNNDNNSGTVVWIQITRPSSDYNLIGGAEQVTFTDPNLSAGGNIDEYVQTTTNGSAVSGLNWTVKVSDDSNVNPTTCTGSLGASITDPNNPPPVISDVVISSVADSSVTVSWSTDKNVTSELDYGTTATYGLTQSDSNSTSSHSFSLTSLSANTTYHFNIKATASSGTSQLGDNTFTTAAAGATVTTQTVTVTKTKTVTPTPSPTPAPDRTPPVINIDTDFSRAFLVSPTILGTASDNKAISKMDYSLDGGRNWLPIDDVSSLGRAYTTFKFLPESLDDGNYSLQVRAVDSSGNTGVSKIYTMVIDRLVPQVSGILFSLGPQIINPRSDGSIIVVENQKFKINLSEVGGSVSMDILAIDLSDKSASPSAKKFSLIKNSESGLWSGNLVLRAGKYQLSFLGTDGAGNKGTRDLNKVVVIAKGTVSGLSEGVKDASITVYYQDLVSKEWQIWDPSAYSEINPQKTDTNGGYSLFLPPGKYFLHIEAFGYKALDTQFFTVNQAEPINANFKLSPLKLLFGLGPIKIYLPDFSSESNVLENNLSSVLGSNLFVGKQIPFFNLSVLGQNSLSADSLSGKPTVLTFLNTWAPSSTEQVSVLDKFSKNKDFNSVVLVEGEKTSKVYIFQKRGNYNLAVYADPDAVLAAKFNLNSLPVHYFLNRKGIVQRIEYGTKSIEELANILINISQ